MRVEFKAVQYESVGFESVVDGKVKFEMAGMALVVLLGAMVLLLKYRWTSGAVDAHELMIGDESRLDGKSIDDFDVGGADVGR